MVLLLVCGCSKRARIADVTKPATVHLTTGDANVHALDVRVRGEVVGAATLVGVDFTQRVSGSFDIAARRGDWYETNYVLRYFPSNVTGTYYRNLQFQASLRVTQRGRPHVILMDINLPGISGFEALEILREDPATTHIPIVALSANAMRDIEKGLKAGFFCYLTKPIKVKEFMDTLNVALESAEKGRRH